MSVLIKDKTTGEWEQVAGGVSNSCAPIGAIFPFGGTSAPSGYLLCDGSAVSRTDYSALFAVIGTSFGAGDGSTTFNVPDLREATTKGVGLSGKSSNHYDSDGVALGEFIDDRFQGHWHNIKDSVSAEAGGTNRGRLGNIDSTGNDSIVRQPVTDGTNGVPRIGATTEVKAVGVNYIIKAKDVNLSVGGQALADRVETLETEYNSLLDLPEQIEAVEEDVEAMKSETSGSATIASGLLGQVTWTKIGRLVQVRVNNVRNESGAIAGGATICTGLPVAKSTTSFAIGRYPNEANVVDLISNGELRQTGMYSVASGIGMFGDFMYISAQ